jgi:hypothetical protein
MMGVFGWLDTGPVKVTIVLWSLSLATLLVLSVMWARPWKLAGVLCLTIGTLVLPVAIQAPVAGEHGITWQGRYLLPVAVGVPLMALVSADGDGQLGRRVPLQRLFGLVLVVCGSALVVSHVVGMQRYVAGLASETVPGSGLVQNYLAADGWRPPVSKVLLLSSAILASLWPAIVLFVPAGRRQGTRPSTKPEEIPEDSAQDVGT